jgi:hypothetical protein
MLPQTPMVEIERQRLPEGQFEWVSALTSNIVSFGNQLTAAERTLCHNLWHTMSRVVSPVTIPNLNKLTHQPKNLPVMLATLNMCRLAWFDSDLKAVLRCPPFSALYTAHQVKAFGWDRAFAASVLDAPVTLLMYGPNVWLTVETVCPRSEEILKFRVIATEDEILQFDAPPQAEQWRVWIPLPDSADGGDYLPQFDNMRGKINAFNTPADLDTHRQYQNDPPGAVYTFEQAIYLSNCLLRAYRIALND